MSVVQEHPTAFFIPININILLQFKPSSVVGTCFVLLVHLTCFVILLNSHWILKDSRRQGSVARRGKYWTRVRLYWSVTSWVVNLAHRPFNATPLSQNIARIFLIFLAQASPFLQSLSSFLSLMSTMAASLQGHLSAISRCKNPFFLSLCCQS